MRIALTGVSGFIGSVIACHLVDSGHTVTGLVRESSRRDHIEPFVDRFVVGEQHDESCWAELLRDAECIVHCSADWDAMRRDHAKHLSSNLMGSIGLLQASAPRQFIFLSTVAVHHDMRPANYDDAGRGLIDENHPLRPGTSYGAYKASVEAHLWTEVYGAGRNCSAIRPCAVYGQDPQLKRTIGHPIVRAIASDRAFARPGGGKFVHVDDVAKVVCGLIANPDASGAILNLADCYARWGDWAMLVGEVLGVEGADIDLGSPAEPKNIFTKDAALKFGVAMDRGMDGIRAEIEKLIVRMREAGEIS